MNEVMNLATVNDLTNKELKKSCKAILNELNKVSHSAWVIARRYADICNDETWKEDFATFKDFANYVNVNRATLQLYAKAVKLVGNICSTDEEISTFQSDVTVSKTVELTRLYGFVDITGMTIYDLYYDFIAYIGGYDALLSKSNKEVRESIVEYENTFAHIPSEAEAEAEAEAEVAAETEAEAEAEANEKNNDDFLLTYETTTENVNDFFKTITNLLKEHGKLNISISL